MADLIGYVRVSKVGGREGESFISPAVQRERIEAQATAGGHVIVGWEEDLDQPGSRYERPGFQAALATVERREAGGIIVASLDRFARSVPDAGVALRRLEAADGVLVSARDNLDTSSPVGKFARTMMLAIAELERDRIRENWRGAVEHAIGRGVHISTVPPVGYQRGKDGRLIPNPVEAPVIRELYLRRGAGATWASLCSFLDDRLPRGGEKLWRHSTVATITRRRTYLGEAAHGSVVNPAAHEPIVSRAEWEAAQSTPRLQAPHKGEGTLLAGIATCATCGGPMTHTTAASGTAHTYRCMGRHSTRGQCARNATVSVPRLDAYVEQAFLARLAHETPIAVEHIATDNGLNDAAAQLEAAEAELAAYRDTNLVTVIGQRNYVDGLTVRATEVDTARATLARLERARNHGRAHVELAATWPNLTLQEKRAILAEVIESLIVRVAPQRGGATPVADRVQLAWREADRAT